MTTARASWVLRRRLYLQEPIEHGVNGGDTFKMAALRLIAPRPGREKLHTNKKLDADPNFCTWRCLELLVLCCVIVCVVVVGKYSVRVKDMVVPWCQILPKGLHECMTQTGDCKCTVSGTRCAGETKSNCFCGEMEKKKL